MTLLNFDIEKNINWSNGIAATGPWVAKLVTIDDGVSQIEISKSFRSCSIIIIVALDGWIYKPKNETVNTVSKLSGKYMVHSVPTRGLNVRIAMNGPLKLTFDEFEEIHAAVAEAKAILEE